MKLACRSSQAPGLSCRGPRSNSTVVRIEPSEWRPNKWSSSCPKFQGMERGLSHRHYQDAKQHHGRLKTLTLDCVAVSLRAAHCDAVPEMERDAGSRQGVRASICGFEHWHPHSMGPCYMPGTGL